MNTARATIIVTGVLLVAALVAAMLAVAREPAPLPVHTIFAAGDSFLARRLNLHEDTPVDRLYGPLLPLMRDADIAFVNLEAVLSDRGTIARAGRPGPCYSFRGRPALVRLLTEAGVDVVSQANNHTGDYGRGATLDSLQILRTAGIKPLGAGRNLREAAKPGFLPAGELITAWIAFQTGKVSYRARERRAGNFYVPLAEVPARIGPIVKRVRQVADLVVVTPHWGNDRAKQTSPEVRQAAHALVDAGADVIFGHSAHWMHGMEFVRDRPVIYNLGDYLGDFTSRGSLAFLFDFDRNGVSRVEGYPVQSTMRGLGFAPPEKHEEILDRFVTLSRENDPQFRYAHRGATIVIELEPEPRAPRRRRPIQTAETAFEPFDFHRKPACVLDELPDDLTHFEETRFGKGLTLLGARLPARVKQDRSFRLDLYFEPSRRMGHRSWTAAVTLLGQEEPVATRTSRHVPADWAYPLDEWEPGEIVEDSSLQLTKDLPPGRYDVFVGLRRAGGKKPIPMKGAADGQTELRIGAIDIVEYMPKPTE